MVRTWLKLVVSGVLLAARLACSQTCTPTYGTTFHSGELNGPVNAIATADLGGGPAAYIGGEFTYAGGMVARHVVRWNGENWSALGEGFDAPVRALAIGVVGGQPRLFAGGDFAASGAAAVPHIAMWDGAGWVPLGSGLNGPVHSLLWHDDGSGEALYVGGQFGPPAGVTASNLVRWRNSSWSAIGGANGPVNALAVHNQGSGPELYVGGAFSSIGGTPANRIARWNGIAWAALGAGLDNGVHALVSHNDGSGPALYVGGEFVTAGGIPAVGVARWNGQAWSGLANATGHGANNHVDTLTVYNGELWAGGKFTAFGTAYTRHMARWDGNAWSGGMIEASHAVRVLHAWHLPLETLLIGGEMTEQSPTRFAFGVVISSRVRVGEPSTGVPTNPFGYPRCLTVFDDGSGPALVAGLAGSGVIPSHVVKWTGSSWAPLGNLCDQVDALAVYDDGSGPKLYAGGPILCNPTAPLVGLVRWTGTAWEPVGGAQIQHVQSLLAYDEDGPGPGRASLFVGGRLSGAGGVPAQGIARWNGAWSELGGGIAWNGTGGIVASMAAHDDGSGEALYAAGRFDHAGGQSCRNVAKWNGAAWSPVGEGVAVSFVSTIGSLLSFNDGTGPALYAGGLLQRPTGPGTISIARWRNQRWEEPGGGITASYPQRGVAAMRIFDDGTGPALFIGGDMPLPWPGPIAKWTPPSWSPAFAAIQPSTTSQIGGIYAFEQFDLGHGRSLIASGKLGSVGIPGGIYTDNIVELRGCACYVNCDGSTASPVLNVVDFICFMNRYAAGDPWANCDGSTAAPLLSAGDFMCFLNAYAVGCP